MDLEATRRGGGGGFAGTATAAVEWYSPEVRCVAIKMIKTIDLHTKVVEIVFVSSAPRKCVGTTKVHNIGQGGQAVGGMEGGDRQKELVSILSLSRRPLPRRQGGI